MVRQSNGAMKLTFEAKSFLNENAIVKLVYVIVTPIVKKVLN